MKRVRTSLFLAVVGVLALCGSAWGIEGMVSHWKFDEGQDSTAYDSAGNNDGVVYGATWTTGQIDGALDFDGVDDYVDVGDIGVTGDWTVGFWAKLDTVAPDIQYPIGTGLGAATGPAGIFMAYSKSQAGRWGIYDGVSYRVGSVVSAGVWYDVAVTKSGTTYTLYLNGNFENDGSLADIDISNLQIGRRSDNWWYVDGLIDDVRIYNRALSSEEIQQLYQDGLPDLVALEMVGLDEVPENFSASYKAVAHYDNNSTRDVTNSALWAVEPNSVANIDENGVLTTKDIVKHRSATILASYMERDVTVEAEKPINILAICLTGTALRFDGVDDYVDVGDPVDGSLDFGAADSFSISAWIKTNKDAPIVSKKRCTGPGGIFIEGYHLSVFQGKLFWTVEDISRKESYMYGTAVVADDQWHHVAAVRDTIEDKLYIYLDGGSDATPVADITTETLATSRSFEIGRSDSTARAGHLYYEGTMDNVRIHDLALSAEEIVANMHTRLAGDEPGLVGYWDFDEGEGQIVYDLSGNGNNGQLGSTPEADSSDPAWVESDAPIGICTLYQIATMAADRALGRKLALLEELLAALAEEWTAYEALEELLESGDYGDLNKGDIVTAKQKIHSAAQHEEQSIDALEKSIEKLIDALNALGYEPEPTPPPPPLPGQASNPNPADGATGVDRNTNLSWTAGSNAVSHNVYFGTTSPGTFRSNQTATTFDPGTMASYTTYYWRIDEVNAGGTTTGTVWSFRTGGGWPPPV